MSHDEELPKAAPAMALNGVDVKKIVVGALMAAGGAVATYLVDQVLPDMQHKDLISASMFIVFSTALNALRRFLTDNSQSS